MLPFTNSNYLDCDSNYLPSKYSRCLHRLQCRTFCAPGEVAMHEKIVMGYESTLNYFSVAQGVLGYTCLCFKFSGGMVLASVNSKCAHLV